MSVSRFNSELPLTWRERNAVAEAIRLAQQIAEEGTGRPNAALSRVQRKLGETVGGGY